MSIAAQFMVIVAAVALLPAVVWGPILFIDYRTRKARHTDVTWQLIFRTWIAVGFIGLAMGVLAVAVVLLTRSSG